MLVFKYPLQKRVLTKLKEEVTQEMQQSGDDVEAEEIDILAKARLMEQGVTTDLENVICEEYTEEEIEHDIAAADFETAFELVERVEEEKRQRELELIASKERERAQQEFERLQAEEKEKADKIQQEFLAKQQELERATKEREAELERQREEA
mmetsp:Transcript_2220/g.3342  ORF Transcript_2220/g.3342 Transcript_2220/m.3342 type:complete len:153 (+) Transcript_2220:1670-2128(+)